MFKSDIDRIDAFFKQWDYSKTKEMTMKGLTAKCIAKSLEWEIEEVNAFMTLQRGWRKLDLAENTYWFEADAFKSLSQRIEAYLQRSE
ncbi:MAG: hypothetical protein PHR66_07875 [Desulfuromonadaceae bacterium]|nr:hypothetical protein [Desulfuromonadaceae bacterium]